MTFIDAQPDCITEGTELKVLCEASPPGKPIGGLLWRWYFPSANTSASPTARMLPLLPSTAHCPRNSEVDTLFFGREVFTYEDVAPEFYVQSQKGDRLINTLTIPNLSRNYHGTHLVCETVHSVGCAQRVQSYIQVKHPPRNLTIELKNGRLLKGFRDGRAELIAFGKENTVLQFSCITSPYFGNVTIKWLKKATGFSVPLNPTTRQRTFNVDSAKRQVSDSTLEMIMPSRDQVGFLICEAWADNRVVAEKAVRLDILYPPAKPTIVGAPVTHPIKMSHAYELTCISEKGNPPPELSWTKNGQPLVTTYKQATTAAGVSLKLELVSQVKDNGAELRCVAKNDASPEGVMSDPVALNIMFPPSYANLTSRRAESVAAGEELELMCETGLSNPPAGIKWRYYHCSPAKLYFEEAYVSIPAFIPFENVTTDTLTRIYSEMELGGWKGCAMKQLDGIDDPPTAQENKGFLSRGRLKLQPKWQDHADFVECLAENEAYGPLTAQAVLRLNVTFAPQFLGLQTGSEHGVVEGSSGVLDLIPYANPPVASVKWLLEGSALKASPIRSDADRTSGLVRRQLKSISGVFAGNPNPRLLTLWNVKRRHMNNYTIEATNAVGNTSSTFILNITYPPEMALTRMIHVNVTLGDTAHLNCEVHANPAVAEGSFLWRRFISPEWNTEGHVETAVATEPIGCNVATRHKNALKHFVTCKTIDETTMGSTLTIYDVTPDDVGEYECIANNGIGPSTIGKVNLYSSFPPSIVKLPRYAKAAASFGTRLTMTCFICTEPEPTVAWLMRRKPDGALVAYDARCDKFIAPDEKPVCLRKAPPVNKRRLQATLSRLRPGHFLATMRISAVQSEDFSEYTCQVTSPSGQDSFVITASGTGPPDTPMQPKVLNVTATTIRISWIQGFGGGYKQTFRVRWKVNKPDAHYKYEDLVEKESGATMQLVITALKPDTEYTISLNARNEMHGESSYSDALIVRTELGGSNEWMGGFHSIKSSGYSRTNSLFIIVSACIVGGIVIFINIMVITFLLRKRQKHIHHGRTGTRTQLSSSGAHGGSSYPPEKIYGPDCVGRPVAEMYDTTCGCLSRSRSHDKLTSSERFSPAQQSGKYFYSADPLLDRMNSDSLKSDQYPDGQLAGHSYAYHPYASATPSQFSTMPLQGYGLRSPTLAAGNGFSHSNFVPSICPQKHNGAFAEQQQSTYSLKCMAPQTHMSQKAYPVPVGGSRTPNQPHLQPPACWSNTIYSCSRPSPQTIQTPMVTSYAPPCRPATGELRRSHSFSDLGSPIPRQSEVRFATNQDYYPSPCQCTQTSQQQLSIGTLKPGGFSRSSSHQSRRRRTRAGCQRRMRNVTDVDGRRGSFTDLTSNTGIRNGFIGYAEDSYRERLVAFQRGESPTRKLLLPNTSNSSSSISCLGSRPSPANQFSSIQLCEQNTEECMTAELDHLHDQNRINGGDGWLNGVNRQRKQQHTSLSSDCIV
ncbi:myoblast fusion [Sparganum proliferum]